MNKDAFSERLREAMLKNNMRQTDLVEYCNARGLSLGRSDVSQYYNGKVVPSTERIDVIASVLGVEAAWLMGYDLSPQPHYISDDEWELVLYYRKASASRREIAKEILNK